MALARRVVSAVVRPLAAVVRVRAASTAAAGLDPIQVRADATAASNHTG